MKRSLIAIVLSVVVVAASFAQISEPEPTVLLRATGRIMPGDQEFGVAPVDWYSVEVPEDGRIEVTAISVDIAPIIVIRQSGVGIEEFAGTRASATVTRRVTAGEQLAIGVVASPSSSPVWDEPEYMIQAVFRSGIERLTVGGTIFGDLGPGDESDGSGSYIDWYPLEVSSDTRIRVSVSSMDFDTYLIVESPDGGMYENDDSNGTDSSVSFETSVGGTARVGVRSWSSGDSGQYELSASVQEVLSIRVGDTIAGELSGGEQVYSIRGVPDQVVDVSVSSFYLDTTLTIDDPDGAYLYNDDTSGSSDSFLSYVFGSSGSATITVGSFGGEGEYTLSVQESTAQVESVGDGYELRDGDVITSRLLSNSPQIDGVYSQRFTFFAEAGEQVEITLESDSFDSYLRLIDPRGFETTDDDSAGNLNARISYMVERSGLHEVYASPLGSGTTGLYTIRFRAMGERVSLVSARGQLTPNDAIDESGKSYDVHLFRAEAGQAITIDVMSDSFDTMITLRDEFENVLAQDDDGGNGSNSRIDFVVQRSGTYQVWVTSFGGGSYGNYSVSVFE